MVGRDGGCLQNLCGEDKRATGVVKDSEGGGRDPRRFFLGWGEMRESEGYQMLSELDVAAAGACIVGFC